jgi:nitrite reductase (NADH) small subunit
MTAGWVAICRSEQLAPETGVAALVGGRQVAAFRTHDGAVFALDNLDPCSGAQVLARGIVGTRGDVAVVSSPMHKQAFDLRTGRCLDAADIAVRAWPARERDGTVEVRP